MCKEGSILHLLSRVYVNLHFCWNMICSSSLKFHDFILGSCKLNNKRLPIIILPHNQPFYDWMIHTIAHLNNYLNVFSCKSTVLIIIIIIVNYMSSILDKLETNLVFLSSKRYCYTHDVITLFKMSGFNSSINLGLLI